MARLRSRVIGDFASGEQSASPHRGRVGICPAEVYADTYRQSRRFTVTSLDKQGAGARRLHEKLYRARGDMENRLKECRLDLLAAPSTNFRA